ncbi:fam-a protein, partial [Plasmodium berghei]
MNKLYIQIVLFILTISLYVNNKTLATELASGENATSESAYYYLTPEELYEKNKHLLCTDPEETINAEKLMNEVVTHLKYHATSNDDYKLCRKNPGISMFVYKKKHQDHTDVQKIKFKFYDSDKYNGIINMLWNPNHLNPFNTGFVKIVRVYNPNLVMIQQRYKKKFGRRQKYFYALATKVE